MAMTLCAANKHYYDPEVHADCPYCGAGQTAAAAPKTQAAPAAGGGADWAKTQPVAALGGVAAAKTVVMGMDAAADDVRKLPVVGWLVVADGPGLGRDFRLIQGENRIGRQAGLEVCLDFGADSDAGISREAHAVVVFDHHAKEFFIERGNSRNLPMLNGSTIRGEPTLQAFDRIQLAATTLLFVPLCHAGLHWEGGLLQMLSRS
ncbi:MAG: FHA domain-containing protein [Eikenella sp.]|nr:FHA domain-containing protein [Eikenella sp.]